MTRHYSWEPSGGLRAMSSEYSMDMVSYRMPMRKVARAGPRRGARRSARRWLVFGEALAVRRLLLAGERNHLVAGHGRGEIELEQAGSWISVCSYVSAPATRAASHTPLR